MCSWVIWEFNGHLGYVFMFPSRYWLNNDSQCYLVLFDKNSLCQSLFSNSPEGWFWFFGFFFFSIKCSPPLLSYCSTSFVAFLPTSCLFVCGFSILLWFLRDCITLYPFVSIGGLFHLWVSVLQKERTRFFCFSYAPLHTSVYIKAAQ